MDKRKHLNYKKFYPNVRIFIKWNMRIFESNLKKLTLLAKEFVGFLYSTQ